MSIAVVSYSGGDIPVSYLVKEIPDLGKPNSPLLIWNWEGTCGVVPPARLKNIVQLYEECRTAAGKLFVSPIRLSWNDVQPAEEIIRYFNLAALTD